MPSPQGQIGECQQETKKEQVCVSINYKHIGNELDQAVTLLARDYKGFSSGRELSNGVVEG